MFSHTAIGLDISDNTIELVELSKKGSKIECLNKIGLTLEEGIVVRGIIKDEKKLKDVIDELINKAGCKGKEVVFGLPESQVFLHFFNLEKYNKKEEEDLVFQEVKANIPLVEDQIAYVYTVLSKSKQITTFLAAVANKSCLKQWQDFFKQVNIKVNIFDIETLASERALHFQSSEKVSTYGVIDIGARTTNISIFEDGYLTLSHTISLGGETITKRIATTLKMTRQKAESEKLNKTVKTTTAKIIDKFLVDVVKEINKSAEYYSSKSERKLEQIFYIGGTSQLNGFLKKIQQLVKIPAQIGKSVVSTNIEGKYLQATGLALRGVSRITHYDLYFSSSLINNFLQEKESVVASVSGKEEDVEESEDTAEVSLAVDDEEEEISKSKYHKQFIVLIVLIALMILIIPLSFWYSKQQKIKRNIQIQEMVEKSINSTKK